MCIKFKKNGYFSQDDGTIDLSESDIELIDHTGVLVASISALIIILINALTVDSDLLSAYVIK